MGLYTGLPRDIETVDINIARGGTAGCIVAARLAEVDPGLSVLVLKSGPNGVGNPAIDYPAFLSSNPSPDLDGREITVPCGAVLGGGSAINTIILMKHCKRSIRIQKSLLETCHGPGSMDTHGSNGPIHVSAGTYRYLHPRLEHGQHPNLHVVIESPVVRILFDNKKARGVVMVVVSRGAFGTPAVLERSGVGSPDILQRPGITRVVADVPGVGHEYDDHHLLLCPYKSSVGPEGTVDDVTCKLRPTEKDVAALGPDSQKVWNAELRNDPTKPLMMMALPPRRAVGIPPGQYFEVSTFTTYPFSRGHVHITGPEFSDPLDFDTGFFADEKGIDLKKHRWAYKKQREVARRMEVFRGELPGGHPPFPTGSDAACVAPDGPLANGQDIEYSAEDDAIIDKFACENVSSPWHSSGGGNLDPSLRVHGVRNLKIADLSIVPKNVAANTNNAALVVSEKPASIVMKELGLAK
ncbi:alcohol oxidase [Xylariaceae sp. FL0804]|nr:alcohol oxidase [Xylariaceae sp. FL0804]